MNLYTGRGDDGNTDLFGGGRVPKHHVRVAAYGAADEMNAALGVAASACEEMDGRLAEIIDLLQDKVFVLGADLATPPGGPHEDKVPRIKASDAKAIESLIDEIDGENDPLKTFVLPGGCELAARLHVARASSRRCERAVTALQESESCGDAIMIWINRTSDLLFAMARSANRCRGIQDRPWTASSD
ncbi:MAG: cob(I)yrinic acid a,c-diamide adenosyltransferase [Planctomycetota bacterium]|nr:cob(I)yrinic acid a,c-diamide adenosyltransferase [Planctomycetota bacterium]